MDNKYSIANKVIEIVPDLTIIQLFNIQAIKEIANAREIDASEGDVLKAMTHLARWWVKNRYYQGKKIEDDEGFVTRIVIKKRVN